MGVVKIELSRLLHRILRERVQDDSATKSMHFFVDDSENAGRRYRGIKGEMEIGLDKIGMPRSIDGSRRGPGIEREHVGSNADDGAIFLVRGQ